VLIIVQAVNKRKEVITKVRKEVIYDYETKLDPQPIKIYFIPQISKCGTMIA